MSSTSAQIDAANKMAERVFAGEVVAPKLNSGNASASQLTAVTPQQPGIDIADDAVVGGSNRESFPIVESREATPVVVNREVAPVIGLDQEHPLKNEFLDPRIKAEDQTALADEQKTTAEKNTELDKTTAAKQTKLPADSDADAESADAEGGDQALKTQQNDLDKAKDEQKELAEKAKAEHKKDVAKAAAKEHDKPKAEKAKTTKKTVEVVDKKSKA